MFDDGYQELRDFYLTRGYRYQETNNDRPGTPEEKVKIQEELAAERGEPYNKRKELRILKGARRTPYVSLNGEEFKTVKAKDKRNKELFREFATWWRTQEGGNPFPWLGSDPGPNPATANFVPGPVYSNGVLVGSVEPQTFEELFAEAQQELASAHDVGPDYGRLAVITFSLKRPNRFVRIYRAVREAIS